MEVTVRSARSLPKMDLLGSCDAFCELEWLGQKFKTSVKKNTYSPEWHETFTFNYVFPTTGLQEWAEASKLRITVSDWDLLGDADYIGSSLVPAGQLVVASRHKQKPAELCPIGHDSVELALLGEGGTPVKGKDGIGALLDVGLRVLDRPPPPLAAVVRVSVLQARDLIAMDRGGNTFPTLV